MIHSHIKCSLICVGSSVVPDTLMNVLLNLNTLHSMTAQNARHQHSSALLLIFPPICKLSSGSYSYRHIELSLFCKFRQFSHFMTTNIESQVVLWCILSMEQRC